ncbi:MAG: hypothetical protein B6I38_00270 [Anaerolineaceae bacterium 4572_5.1]|nr:MAG: hypothetical protein B6I38_00270 [Anaerolineaceae bacterium 4572_5.1]RLD05565.1 MAG: hypothetical protein DRI56_09340 [Chloroflexota bacterium]
MNPKKWLWQALGLLLVVIIGVIVVNSVRSSIADALKPISNMTNSMATQVSNVMHPTPTILPDPVTIIHDVRSLARLETIQYSLEKVITAETRQGAFEFFVGDKLLFVAHGEVIAGIDLEKLGPEDLEVEGQVLYVTLPEPEIFITALDNELSYVYNRDTGIFTHGDVNLETEARRAAEDEIEKAAIEDGILDLARQNAENYLSRLFRDLGFPEVIFREIEDSN